MKLTKLSILTVLLVLTLLLTACGSNQSSKGLDKDRETTSLKMHDDFTIEYEDRNEVAVANSSKLFFEMPSATLANFESLLGTDIEEKPSEFSTDWSTGYLANGYKRTTGYINDVTKGKLDLSAGATTEDIVSIVDEYTHHAVEKINKKYFNYSNIKHGESYRVIDADTVNYDGFVSLYADNDDPQPVMTLTYTINDTLNAKETDNMLIIQYSSNYRDGFTPEMLKEAESYTDNLIKALPFSTEARGVIEGHLDTIKAKTAYKGAEELNLRGQDIDHEGTQGTNREYLHYNYTSATQDTSEGDMNVISGSGLNYILTSSEKPLTE